MRCFNHQLQISCQNWLHMSGFFSSQFFWLLHQLNLTSSSTSQMQMFSKGFLFTQDSRLCFLNLKGCEELPHLLLVEVMARPVSMIFVLMVFFYIWHIIHGSSMPFNTLNPFNPKCNVCIYLHILPGTYTYIIQPKLLALPDSPSRGHESHLLWCDGHLLKTAGHMRSTLNQRPFDPKLQDLMELSSRNGEGKNRQWLSIRSFLSKCTF